jgi:hypothetical protein
LLELFGDLVFIQKIYHVLQTHKEGKLVSIPLKPNIVNFLRKIVTVGVEMPF